jgi:hypothetical protein
VEHIRMMRYHIAASSIPPSEIPSGARNVKEGLTQASSTSYRRLPLTTRSTIFKKWNAKGVPNSLRESPYLPAIEQFAC